MLLDIGSITKDQQKFYDVMFGNFNNYIEVRLIDQDNKSKSIFLTYNELINYPTPIDTNVYVGVYERRNKGSGKTGNCTKTNVVYLDIDNQTHEQLMLKIKENGLPRPSMIVHSGNGYHVYWRLDKPAGHELKPIIDKLASILKADTLATDTARILRVPDTFNIKNGIKECKLVEFNDNEVTIEQLEYQLGVIAKLEHKTYVNRNNVIPELAKIKYNGLHNMAFGVKKGERNFCTGRIVQTLKKLNYTKRETFSILYKWNRLNKPKKNTEELNTDINAFWHADKSEKQYRYAGKTFTNDRLEELNRKFIDKQTLFFKSDEVNSLHYDNDLLGDDFHKLNGLTFAVLAFIKLSIETKEKGMTKRKLSELSRRHLRDKTLEQSLRYLEGKGHITTKSRKGYPTYYFPEEKPFSQERGFTAVPKLLHRMFISEIESRELEKVIQKTKGTVKRQEHQPYERLNELRYKLLILLESYAYDNKRIVFVGNRTIADRMRVHSRTVKRNLQWLEDNHYITIYKEKGKRYIKLIYA